MDEPTPRVEGPGMLRRSGRVGLIGLFLLGGAVLAPTPALAKPTINAVSFTVYACPAWIQSPADLANAGGEGVACAVAGRAGDFGSLQPGYTWAIDPVEYDLEASLAASGGSTLTSPEPTAGGFCDTITMVCHAFQSYGWF